MEHFVQAGEVMLLVIAWLVAIRYLRRSWPTHAEMRKIGRRLGDEMGSVFPDWYIEIGNVCRKFRIEIKGVFPVFSAQTMENREAEFIPDRLPGRFPFWITLLAIIAIGGLAWWITK